MKYEKSYDLYENDTYRGQFKATELMSILKVSRPTLSQYAKKGTTPQGYRIEDVASYDKQELIEDYLNGCSLNELSEKYGIHQNTVYGVLHKAGINTSKRKTIDNDTRRKIYAMSDKGIKASQIAEETGIKLNTVNTIIGMRGAQEMSLFIPMGEQLIDTSSCEFAKPAKPTRVVFEGKRFLDMTAMFG